DRRFPNARLAFEDQAGKALPSLAQGRLDGGELVVTAEYPGRHRASLKERHWMNRRAGAALHRKLRSWTWPETDRQLAYAYSQGRLLPQERNKGRHSRVRSA